MLADIGVVVWKEWIEWKRQYGSRRTAWIISIGMLVLFGLILPLQFGQGWFQREQALYAWITLPVLLLLRSMGDTFAGERERHTLETLLATRLPDMALYLGKLLVPAGYTWVFTQLVMLIALIPLHFLDAGSGWEMYSFSMLIAGGWISFLSSLYAAAAGILLSLRSPTVDSANQSMFLFLILFAVLLGAVRAIFAILMPGAGMLAEILPLTLVFLGADSTILGLIVKSTHRRRLLF
jgi:ABC-2 type transport system permease protein